MSPSMKPNPTASASPEDNFFTEQRLSRQKAHDGTDVFTARFALPQGPPKMNRHYAMVEKFLTRRAGTLFRNAKRMYDFFKLHGYAFAPHDLEFRFTSEIDGGKLKITTERVEYGGGAEAYALRSVDSFSLVDGHFLSFSKLTPFTCTFTAAAVSPVIDSIALATAS
ncbi:hypothetical protein FACS1894202_12900 [Clostridia bacterium]|nr:hypothetical protein FACS1894202_12900 [Clostridia bacterium]